MATELMTYYYSDLKKCADQIKTINQTVQHKNEHFSRASEIKKIQEYCFATTNDYNFNYEYSHVQNYFNAAYNFKKYTKKELDIMLKQCYRYLGNEINGIISMGKSGELNLVYDLETA